MPSASKKAAPKAAPKVSKSKASKVKSPAPKAPVLHTEVEVTPRITLEELREITRANNRASVIEFIL